jgi:DNA repair protein RadC
VSSDAREDGFGEPRPAEPLHAGHRDRLRERFNAVGDAGVADYELLELILFRAIPRRDVKPLAKAMIARFGSFAETLAARPERLREIAGLGESAITDLKVVEAAARRLTRGAVKARQTLGSWTEVLDYCRTAMAFNDREEFRVLFLDKRNVLIDDESRAAARWTTRPCIRAKSCAARWSSARRRWCWSTTTLPATRRRRPPTSA